MCVIFPVLVGCAQVGKDVSGGQKKALKSPGADMTKGSQESITKGQSRVIHAGYEGVCDKMLYS